MCLFNSGSRSFTLSTLIRLSTTLLALRTKASIEMVNRRLIKVGISAAGSTVGASALQERIAPTVENRYAGLGTRRLAPTLALFALGGGTWGLGSGTRSLRLEVGLGHNATMVVWTILALVALVIG